MHLLVTRPQPGAGETAELLRRAGHRVHCSPVLEVVLHSPPGSVPDPGALAVTSRHGLRALERWPQASAWRDLPLYAVGEATAAAAREMGFGRVQSAAGDAAALAQLIASDYTGGEQPLVYPAARERAADLAGLLATAGIRVVVIEAYHVVSAERLDEVARATLVRDGFDGVLVYSRRSAAALVALVRGAGLDKHLGDTALMALSDAVAEPLRDFGLKDIRVARSPDEAGMLALLQELR